VQMEMSTGALAKMGTTLSKLADFMVGQEDSDLDEFGTISLAYSRPTGGDVHTMRLKVKDLAAVDAKKLFEGSELNSEEEAAETQALDEAIAMATEGIHFMGEEQGPSAATVLRAKVTGSIDFRRAVAEHCPNVETAENCRRDVAEELLCKLAKNATLLGHVDEAAAKGLPCSISSEALDNEVVLMAGKAKTQVRGAGAAEGSAEDADQAKAASEMMAEFDRQKAEKPWEHVEKLAGSMLQSLREGAWPQLRTVQQ